mmetsp:Transcript_2915/g.8785  ORF Transcript_2915/g.8785 Transcript_2915/m.8785 type:complete len:242 (+) Transcript_2915:841-1566(+)
MQGGPVDRDAGLGPPALAEEDAPATAALAASQHLPPGDHPHLWNSGAQGWAARNAMGARPSEEGPLGRRPRRVEVPLVLAWRHDRHRLHLDRVGQQTGQQAALKAQQEPLGNLVAAAHTQRGLAAARLPTRAVRRLRARVHLGLQRRNHHDGVVAGRLDLLGARPRFFAHARVAAGHLRREEVQRDPSPKFQFVRLGLVQHKHRATCLRRQSQASVREEPPHERPARDHLGVRVVDRVSMP